MASDNVCGDGLGNGQCFSSKLGPIQNADGSQSDGPSWDFANHPGNYENIGYGLNLTQKGSFPYINAGHPGGFNVTMCDGSVHYLRNTISGTVWAKLVHLRRQQAAGSNGGLRRSEAASGLARRVHQLSSAPNDDDRDS